MKDILSPGLYIVATPIGNLGDLTRRAAHVLASADLIAAEDTRVTVKLLAHLDLSKPMTPYHDHNAEQARPRLLERARTGIVALVSDAGTPLISDPGYKLVRAAREQGIAVTTIPGPCAAIAALSVAGLPTDRFLFLGFLPPKSTGRQKALVEVASVHASLVLYETGPRLEGCLSDIAEVLGPREVAIARELTKLHEEVRRGTAGELAQSLADHPPLKGEIVLVIGPPIVTLPNAENLDDILVAALATHSLKEAVQITTDQTALPRKTVYARALELKERV